MKQIFIIIFSLLFFSSSGMLKGQAAFSGIIVERNTGAAVPDVNVMLQSKDGKGLFSYTISGIDGKYTLKYFGQADSVRIAVAGMNIKAVHMIIPARSKENLNIPVTCEALKIKEVVVKSNPAKRSSDTINYYVASYIDSIDRSIGDVLKKMPGIEVAQSGRISYNGKPIGKFYIEGMDMLGGSYGIATNNVRARDIAAVQVLEFHQPIKALKKIQLPDMTAINLKLKEGAKGTFNATVLLGGGYKPGMWQGEATAMYFGRKFQTLNTYKSNNTGEDVTGEMESLYRGASGLSEMIGIRIPSTPPLNKERYLNNNIHAVSLNAIRKVTERLELVLNGKYYHDSQNSYASSMTTYYLPDQSPLVIIEQTHANLNSHFTKFEADLKSNTDANYFQDKLSFTGKWDNHSGLVNDIKQRFTLPKISFTNHFQYVKPLRFTTLEIKSRTGFYNTPSTLFISPCIYPQIFGFTNEVRPDARQIVNSRRFSINNSIMAAKETANWTFSLFAGINVSLDWMNSSLNPLEAKIIMPTSDSLTNRIYGRDIKIQAGPSVIFRPTSNFDIRLSTFIEYNHLHIGDKIKNKNTNLNKVLTSPSLQLNARLSNDLKLTAGGSFNENYGGLYDVYSGYIMTDYRIISGMGSLLPDNKHQSYYVDFNYGNPLVSIFSGLRVTYWRNNSNLMYGTKFSGSLSRVESFEIPNLGQGYDLQGKFSKRFDNIATSITLSGGYSRSYRNILREEVVLDTRYNRATLGLDVTTQWGEPVRFDYEIAYSRMGNDVKNSGETFPPIDALRQKATLNIVFARKGIIKLSGEHYYDNNVAQTNKSIFFADVRIIYKTKRFEYILEGRNLLNTKSYHSSLYNNVTAYEYNYAVRPLAVIFKIKFSLR